MTIAAVIVKISKPIKAMSQKLDRMEIHSTDNYLSVLRLTIMSTEMPLEERIAAGDKYIKLGGNGAVKRKYEQLLEQLQ